MVSLYEFKQKNIMYCSITHKMQVYPTGIKVVAVLYTVDSLILNNLELTKQKHAIFSLQLLEGKHIVHLET